MNPLFKAGDLGQGDQIVKGNLDQSYQNVEGYLNQARQIVKGAFLNHILE